MKDDQLAFRMAVFQALDGQLTYDSSPVPVCDEKLVDANNTVYVILSTQTRNNEDTFSSWNGDHTLLLDIVNKEYAGASKNIIDDVGDQILRILFPAPATDGLVQQSGFTINCLQVDNISTINLLQTNKSIIRKLIRLRAKVYQT